MDKLKTIPVLANSISDYLDKYESHKLTTEQSEIVLHARETILKSLEVMDNKLSDKKLDKVIQKLDDSFTAVIDIFAEAGKVSPEIIETRESKGLGSSHEPTSKEVTKAVKHLVNVGKKKENEKSRDKVAKDKNKAAKSDKSSDIKKKSTDSKKSEKTSKSGEKVKLQPAEKTKKTKIPHISAEDIIPDAIAKKMVEALTRFAGTIDNLNADRKEINQGMTILFESVGDLVTKMDHIEKRLNEIEEK